MANMNEEQISRFEANIERLVESAFANFFGQKLRAQDIALQLARAMEDNAKSDGTGDRLLAPDHYRIRFHPHIHQHLLEQQPNLQAALGQHLIMLAMQTGYKLNNVPIIEFVPDDQVDKKHVTVNADHTDRPENSTTGMQRVLIPLQETPANSLLNAFLLINGERSMRLEQDIINIGRFRDNDIILDDPYVSRHHLQLRRRFGVYILFDVHSQGGTWVNNVQIKEHQLQTGDVIMIGKTQLLYMIDQPLDDSHLTQTDVLDPIV